MFKIDNSKFDKYKKLYDQNGYLIIEDVLSSDKCEDIKKKSQEFIELPEYPVALNVHRKSDFFWKIISNDKIVDLVKFIQDSDIDAVNDQYLFKKANTKYGRQSWTFHQDNSYPKAKKGSYIILHLAVDESTKENGGLIYLQGSHSEEILDYQNNKSWKEDNNEDGITRPGQTINYEQEMIKKYKPIDVVFPKGSISLMHGNLIHGSHPNLSKDKDRNQYSMCYMNRGVEFFKGKSSPRLRAKLY